MGVQTGYNMIYWLWKYSFDADCDLFLKILKGDVREDVYTAQRDLQVSFRAHMPSGWHMTWTSIYLRGSCLREVTRVRIEPLGVFAATLVGRSTCMVVSRPAVYASQGWQLPVPDTCRHVQSLDMLHVQHAHHHQCCTPFNWWRRLDIC